MLFSYSCEHYLHREELIIYESNKMPEDDQSAVTGII
jgi:hypothetical protein